MLAEWLRLISLKRYFMKFEIGKCYEHATGKKMKIIGCVYSMIYDICLIGETLTREFLPIGQDEEATVNWRLIDEI
jgi:hypothetical protein